MVLLTPDKTIYINEDAREELSKFWPNAYKKNMKRLIPMMADDLANDIISVNGVKTSGHGRKYNNYYKSLNPLQ